MAGDPRSGLERLRAAADSGELDAICARHGVLLLSAFGSATRTDSEPRDLDVAVAFDRPEGLLPFLEDLVALTGIEQLDLMDLRAAGPVARERALVGAVPFYERAPGLFARAQMAAMTQRMDTEWLRRLDLELMAR